MWAALSAMIPQHSSAAGGGAMKTKGLGKEHLHAASDPYALCFSHVL